MKTKIKTLLMMLLLVYCCWGQGGQFGQLGQGAQLSSLAKLGQPERTNYLAQPSQSDETADPGQPGQPAETARLSQPAKAAETARLSQPTKTAELSQFSQFFPLTRSVQAQGLEVPEPYIAANTIPSVAIDKEGCLVLLRESQPEEATDTIKENLATIEAEINKVKIDYDAVNAEIVRLESGATESLTWAQSELEGVIDVVYQSYSESEEFTALTEDEQMEWILTDATVISWLDYISELERVIQAKISERTQLENYYLNLNYDLETLKSQENQWRDRKEEYNQCLLYPYSVASISPDSVMLNNQLELNDYLVQIDQLLKSLIPRTYANVQFQDIYQRFNRPIPAEELEMSYVTKTPIILDPYAFDIYSYAKELNLKDIQTIVEFAQYERNQTGDEGGYGSLYAEVLKLKENQWEYIYSINSDVFELIKTSLAEYLNNNGYVGETDVEFIRGLHQRNQVKLVLYNEGTGSWSTNNGVQTGYYEDYLMKEITTAIPDQTTSETSEEEITTVLHTIGDPNVVDGEDGTEGDSDDNNSDNSDSIKDKLINPLEPDGGKRLPVPTPVNDLDKAPEEVVTQDAPKESGQLKLPSTGETMGLTIVALVLLIIGIILLAYNYWRRVQYRREIDEIELD